MIQHKAFSVVIRTSKSFETFFPESKEFEAFDVSAKFERARLCMLNLVRLK